LIAKTGKYADREKYWQKAVSKNNQERTEP